MMYIGREVKRALYNLEESKDIAVKHDCMLLPSLSESSVVLVRVAALMRHAHVISHA